MKKAKEGTLNLYNFNAHDDDNKKKVKKSKKSNAKKKSVKKANNIKNEDYNSKFDFNNEIVIGLPKEQDEIASKNKKKKAKNKVKKGETRNTNKKGGNKNTKQKVSKKERKVNKSISKKEQEIKSKRPKRNFKIIKYSFLLICIIAIIIATALSPLFNIKEIIVEGNEKITKEEIISLSQININENTYKTNMSKVKQRILENPYIKSVEIKRVLPSKVSITIEERKTTFMFEYGSGYVYINNQGYILELSNEKLDVPILQGAETAAEDFVPGNRININDLEKMSTVIKIMEIAANNDIAHLITRIDIENSQNYKILFENEQKVAYLGDETDLSTKILSIKAILEKEQGISGEIFVNMDLKNNYPTFRQTV